jgi:hypothetical protein
MGEALCLIPNCRRVAPAGGAFCVKHGRSIGGPEICLHGHPLDGENLRVDAAGHRHCRECGRQAAAKCMRKKRAALRAKGLSSRGTKLGVEWRIRLNLPL